MRYHNERPTITSQSRRLGPPEDCPGSTPTFAGASSATAVSPTTGPGQTGLIASVRAHAAKLSRRGSWITSSFSLSPGAHRSSHMDNRESPETFASHATARTKPVHTAASETGSLQKAEQGIGRRIDWSVVG